MSLEGWLKKSFFIPISRTIFLILNNGSNYFSLNFKAYSPWDSSTFDMLHIYKKWPHLPVQNT